MDMNCLERLSSIRFPGPESAFLPGQPFIFCLQQVVLSIFFSAQWLEGAKMKKLPTTRIMAMPENIQLFFFISAGLVI